MMADYFMFWFSGCQLPLIRLGAGSFVMVGGGRMVRHVNSECRQASAILIILVVLVVSFNWRQVRKPRFNKREKTRSTAGSNVGITRPEILHS